MEELVLKIWDKLNKKILSRVYWRLYVDKEISSINGDVVRWWVGESIVKIFFYMDLEI